LRLGPGSGFESEITKPMNPYLSLIRIHSPSYGTSAVLLFFFIPVLVPTYFVPGGRVATNRLGRTPPGASVFSKHFIILYGTWWEGGSVQNGFGTLRYGEVALVARHVSVHISKIRDS
jgi:hypothetical protein